MSFKSPENSTSPTNVDKKAATSLAELLDARSREYLKHCLDTNPSADRHTVWSRLYAVTQRLKLAVLAGGRSHICDAVIEIGSNLLGCEEMAVLEVDTEYADISIVTSVGLTAVDRQTLKAHAKK